MKPTLLFLSILLLSELSSQNKQDYVWVFGSNTNTWHEGNDGFTLDFNQRPMKLEERAGDLEFTRANASICDKYGNLLMYTNGCAIANANHKIMPNGEGINSGDYFDQWLDGDCRNGYLVKQDLMFLPDPADSSGYYLIHIPIEQYWDLEPGSPTFGEIERTMEYLKYSYVDMNLDNDLGDVTIKNEEVFKSRFLFSHTTAISHSNGMDYWILKHADRGNRHYKFLLDESGVSIRDSQDIGLIYGDVGDQGSGDSKFSPDGTKYVFFNFWGIRLYDFDRTTGELSNFRHLPWTRVENSWATTVSFSPNSRFIYLMDQFRMFQLDTEAENLEDGLILIDEWDGTFNPFHTTFYISALAPDCKIYVRPGSSSDSWSIIHNPDEKGMACNFVQNDLKMLYTSGLGNIPYFPRFRVDEEEKCDSTIDMVDGLQVFWRRDLLVYPNPVTDYVKISIPSSVNNGTVFLINSDGNLLHSTDFYNEQEIELNLSEVPVGNYYLELIPRYNSEKTIYTASFVKVN